MSQLLQFYKSFQQARAPVAKAAPTFEDLTIDDKLTEHQRLLRYTKSTIGLQRLVHVKMLADVATIVGFNETVATIIPIIEPLSKDTEPVVKQHLVEQLKHLAKFCCEKGKEEGYKIMITKLLPVTAHLLEDDKPEVRQSASMTLVEIAKLVSPDDIGQYVLTIILRLAHEDDKEEMRMTACSLLNLLAESLGHDLCKQFVIPEVVSLAEDPAFRVRKSTALNFHSICKVGGEHELLERLMPAFVRLSKDDMYRVRRACAESLSEIAKNVSEDIRLGVLVEIYLRLTQDPSKLVKQSVLQQSGMFIATLPSKYVTENILSHYISMISGPTGDVSVDAELKHVCAYTFPAVLQIIGRNRWKEVRELYHSLAQSRAPNIKQTLAYSLHEVAKILGEGKLVEEELVPVFEDMIQDVEAVQMGVIKHLAVFLGMLPEPCRVSYLPLLHDILHSTNPFNWRLRQYLAIQLPDLILLPPKTELYRTLFPLVMILLQDPVASVRRDSFKGVTSLFNSLYALSISESSDVDPQLRVISKMNMEEVARIINSLIDGDKYQLRQLWIELCQQLLRDVKRELFERYFIQGILTLALDPVSNVRIALSYFIVGWGNDLPPWENVSSSTAESADSNSNNNKSTSTPTPTTPRNDGTTSPYYPWHWLLRRNDIKEVIIRLSRDDNDIFLNLSKLQPLYPDINFSSMTCRGRKAPPGGNVPIKMSPIPGTIDNNNEDDDNGININSNNKDEIPFTRSGSFTTQSQQQQLTHFDTDLGHSQKQRKHSFSSVDSEGHPIAKVIDMSAVDIERPRLPSYGEYNKLQTINVSNVNTSGNIYGNSNNNSGGGSGAGDMDEELDRIDGIPHLAVGGNSGLLLPTDLSHLSLELSSGNIDDDEDIEEIRAAAGANVNITANSSDENNEGSNDQPAETSVPVENDNNNENS